MPIPQKRTNIATVASLSNNTNSTANSHGTASKSAGAAASIGTRSLRRPPSTTITNSASPHLDKLRQHKQTLTLSFEALERKNKELKEENEEAKRELEVLATEVRVLKGAVRDLEEDVGRLPPFIGRVMMEVKCLRGEVEEMKQNRDLALEPGLQEEDFGDNPERHDNNEEGRGNEPNGEQDAVRDNGPSKPPEPDHEQSSSPRPDSPSPSLSFGRGHSRHSSSYSHCPSEHPQRSSSPIHAPSTRSHLASPPPRFNQPSPSPTSSPPIPSSRGIEPFSPTTSGQNPLPSPPTTNRSSSVHSPPPLITPNNVPRSPPPTHSQHPQSESRALQSPCRANNLLSPTPRSISSPGPALTRISLQRDTYKSELDALLSECRTLKEQIEVMKTAENAVICEAKRKEDVVREAKEGLKKRGGLRDGDAEAGGEKGGGIALGGTVNGRPVAGMRAGGYGGMGAQTAANQVRNPAMIFGDAVSKMRGEKVQSPTLWDL